MNFDLNQQRHQFGVLLVLFILVYSVTANEPRMAIQEIEQYSTYDENCKFGDEITLNDEVRDYCDMWDDEISQLTNSYIFRCGILLFAGVIAVIAFLGESEDA